jgi:hypothetical protein
LSKTWDRLTGRGSRRAADEETVLLSSREHAWWAGRETLERPFAAAKPRPEPAPAGARARATSAFEDYFSTESLFEDPATDGALGADNFYDSSDPWVVLGLPETSTWEQITAEHRRLAKLHHPDRLTHASAIDRELSEQRMRELNIAYSELRRRRGR